MKIEPLGQLARTHTCGELTAADVGAGRRPARLGAPRPRSRLARVRRPPRPPRHHAGRGARQRRRSSPRPSGCVRSSSSRVLGRVERASPEAVNPKLQTGEIEVAAREIRLLNDAKTPPFPIADETPVSRGHAPEVPLSRPAPAAHAAQHDAAAPRDDGDPEVLRRAGLPRDRDADAHEVDAGRGARLPGAEPRASGRVLRAAAVAADLQADPDDRRAWTATSRS